MDRQITTADIDQAIEAMMRDRGVDRGEAEVLVAMATGELHDDLLAIRPLSPRQRQKRTRTLRETMAELSESGDEVTEPSTLLPQRSVVRQRKTG